MKWFLIFFLHHILHIGDTLSWYCVCVCIVLSWFVRLGAVLFCFSWVRTICIVHGTSLISYRPFAPWSFQSCSEFDFVLSCIVLYRPVFGASSIGLRLSHMGASLFRLGQWLSLIRTSLFRLWSWLSPVGTSLFRLCSWLSQIGTTLFRLCVCLSQIGTSLFLWPCVSQMNECNISVWLYRPYAWIAVKTWQMKEINMFSYQSVWQIIVSGVRLCSSG